MGEIGGDLLPGGGSLGIYRFGGGDALIGEIQVENAPVVGVHLTDDLSAALQLGQLLAQRLGPDVQQVGQGSLADAGVFQKNGQQAAVLAHLGAGVQKASPQQDGVFTQLFHQSNGQLFHGFPPFQVR